MSSVNSDKEHRDIQKHIAKVLLGVGIFITCDKCRKQNYALPEELPGKYYTCKYCKKEIKYAESIFKELLVKADLDMKDKSFRDAVFNCYSALEVYLAESIRWILEIQDIPKEIIDYIFKKRPSIEDFIELLNNYVSSKINYGKEIKPLTELRNNVIHRGYKPKPKETTDCFMEVKGLISKIDADISQSPKVKSFTIRRAAKKLLYKI